MNPLLRTAALSALVLALAASGAFAQRQAENLGRGVIAIRTSSTQVYVGWRLLGNDPDSIAFNLYRSINGAAYTKLNSTPISASTNYQDTPGSSALTGAISYYVKPVINGVEQPASAAYTLPANTAVTSDGSYISVPLATAYPNPNSPTNAYDVKFCWVGDLDADGEYDFVVDRASTVTDENRYLEAYKRDGTFLWRMDMGPNSVGTYDGYDASASVIATGDKDDVTVYDLDGDGKAEVAVRTANGVTVKDASGAQVASITAADNLTQFVSIIDGMTGAERARTALPNVFGADGPLHNQCAIAYLDGQRPSVIFFGENRVGTGSFQRSCTAYDFRDGALTQRWNWRTGDGVLQGAESHQIRVADVDNDGKDELINIGYTTDDDGKTLFRINDVTHGDRLHVADMDPERPGLETFAIQQYNPTLLATMLYRSQSGETIRRWYATDNVDVGRGLAVDINSPNLGYEVFSTQAGIFNAKGQLVYSNSTWPFEGLWWDADLGREFIAAANGDGTTPTIDKFSETSGTSGRMLSLYKNAVHQAFGARPAFWGDLFGDWREEAVLVANDYKSLKIFTTTTAATNRIYTLMQNPAYRMQSTTKGYAEGSYPDFYLGYGMNRPPPPPIVTADLVWAGTGASTWDTSSSAWRNATNTNSAVFSASNSVRFDIGGNSTNAIALSGQLRPSAVTVYSPKDYTFDGTAGSLAGTMTMMKSGRGTLRMTGTNSYTGATTVWDGALRVDGDLSGSPVTIWGGTWGGAMARGATGGRLSGSGKISQPVTLNYGGAITPGAGTNAAGTITLGAGLTANSDSALVFDLSNSPAGTNNDRLSITGNLVLSGKVSVIANAVNGSLGAGTYTLATYSGTLTGGATNLAVSVPEGTPYSVALGSGALNLVIPVTRAATNVVWVGGKSTNTWDIASSTNWTKAGVADVYVAGDSVTFGDAGGTNTSVTLNVAAPVSAMVVSGAANYTFRGSGAIAGAGGLSKSGPGTLTLATTNTFTGPVVITGGTVEFDNLGMPGEPGSLGAGGAAATNLVINGGALRLVGQQAATSRSYTVGTNGATFDISSTMFPLQLSGTNAGGGALIKTGPGALILAASNSHTGGTIIKEGLLSLASDTANLYALGAGTVTIQGGKLRMYDNTGSYTTVAWPINVPAGANAALDADGRCTINSKLIGSGTLTYYTGYIRSDINGDWSAFAGSINATGSDLRLGNSKGLPGTILDLASTVYAFYNATPGTSGTTYQIGGLSGAAGATFGGSITAGRTVTLQVGARNVDTVFAGDIKDGTGPAALTKVGTAALTLSGTNNTYTGPTKVQAGKLILSGGSLGATAVTVSSGAAFGGYGSVAGSVTFNAGSTMLVNPTAGPLAITGNLNFGGTITVSPTSGATVALGTKYVLYTYTGSLTGTPSFVWSDPLYKATFDTSVAGQVSVQVALNTSVSALLWTGGTNSIWDNVSKNWTAPDGTVVNYQNPDNVKFDDSSTNTTVTMTNTLGPASIAALNSTQNYTFAGNGGISGPATLTKAGTGVLTIATTNSYTGATVVSAGKLVLAGGSLSGTSVTVSSGAAFGGNGSVGGNVSFQSGSELLVAPLAAPLTVTGDTTFGGANVNVSLAPGATLLEGSYPVLVCTAAPASLPSFTWSGSGFTATFSSEVAQDSGMTVVSITLLRSPALVWQGTTAAWDTSTTNWINPSNASVTFASNDAVRFDDTGSSATATLSGTLYPSAVTVWSTNKNYTFSGSGALAGAATLTKLGSGTLSITATNNLSGNVYLLGGTLSYSNSSLGTGPISMADKTKILFKTASYFSFFNALTVPAGQTGTVSTPDRFTWKGAVGGSGTLNVNVTTTITRCDLENNWTNFTGQLNFTGSGGVRLINNGGTYNTDSFKNLSLDLGGSVILNPITYSAGMSCPIGALSGASASAKLNGGSAGAANYSVGALGTSTTYAGGITGNASLAKVGAGTLTLTGTNMTYTGSTVVSEGALLFAASNTNTSGVTVAPAATVGGSGSLGGSLTMSNGSRLALGITATATNGLTVAGTSTLNGSITVVPAVNGGTMAPGTYTLLAYTGTLGGSPSFTWNDTTGSGYTATFSTATAGKVQITLMAPVPEKPSGLSAIAGDATVDLAWDATPNATTYSVRRSTTAGSGYEPIASGLTNTAYTDAAATNGVTYHYVVAASNATGTSAASEEVSATPVPPPPDAPMDFRATPGNAQVSLSWTAADTATSYTLSRSTTEGSGYSPIASGIAGTTYTDSGTTNGTAYYYIVTASNAGGTSNHSAEAWATPIAPPPAPTGVTATPGDGQVALAWNTSAGATSYDVLRSLTSGWGFTPIVTGLTNSAYTDATVTNGTSYCYVVRAANYGGSSANSAEAFTTPKAPTSPLDDWRQTYFGTTNATGLAANDGDPDHDGISTLLEYATGSDPLSPSPSAQQLSTSGAYLQLSFRRVADPSLVYSVQGSTNLSAWEAVWQSSGADNVSGPVTVTDTTPIGTGTGAGRYLRLKVDVVSP